MIRGLVIKVLQGAIQRINASGRPDEVISNREFMQHYGFTSRPKEGAEVIFIREGNLFMAIASDDRRFRIALEEGECAIYDDLGQKIHLTREGIDAKSSKKITATAPTVEIVAETKVVMTTPRLEVSGSITAGGDVSDKKGSMASMRNIHNAHTHPDPQGGLTGATQQAM